MLNNNVIFNKKVFALLVPGLNINGRRERMMSYKVIAILVSFYCLSIAIGIIIIKLP